MTSPLSAQKKAALPLFLLIAGSTSISSVFIKLEHLELAMKRRNIAVRPFSTIPFFFFFFIKCMQPMAMALSRRCVYAKLHVIWPKSMLYIFSLSSHTDKMRIRARLLYYTKNDFVKHCLYHNSFEPTKCIVEECTCHSLVPRPANLPCAFEESTQIFQLYNQAVPRRMERKALDPKNLSDLRLYSHHDVPNPRVSRKASHGENP